MAVAVTAAALATGTAAAATVTERRIELTISGGELIESRRLAVAIEEPGDLAAWSEYGVTLDDHIELESIEARVLTANGSLVDCTSFVVMKRLGLSRAFAFDAHFVERGYELIA